MSVKFKLASNLAPFSSLSDRFVAEGYCTGFEFEKQLELLSSVSGIEGVALGWPMKAVKTAGELRKVVENHGLSLATLDANIYTEPRFKHGSLTSSDPKIRRAAIDRIKETIDAAAESNSPDINLWPGHDGFDYLFGGHYAEAWENLENGLIEITEYRPAVRINLEYKAKEPRANIYVANVGKALMLVNKINKPNLGITLDFGHSLAALENPAEAASLAMREGRLGQIHLNDNYRDWDHDLVPGAVNVWDHIEFFYWLVKLGYGGWCCADIYPYREEGKAVVERTVQVYQKSVQIAGELLKRNIDDLLRNNQHLEILRMLWDFIKV